MSKILQTRTYVLVEDITETRTYRVELPDGASQEQVREAAYSQPYKVSFGEVQSIELRTIDDENGLTVKYAAPTDPLPTLGITYTTRNLGNGSEDDQESGVLAGWFTGEVDTWGKHTFIATDGTKYYFFENEFRVQT